MCWRVAIVLVPPKVSCLVAVCHLPQTLPGIQIEGGLTKVHTIGLNVKHIFLP